MFHIIKGSQDNTFSMVTGCGLDRLGIGVSTPGRGKKCFCL
jgi:hypothetical protein